MEINVADLTWSSFVYPRGGKNEKTVEAYVEALTIGAKFPPIKIQRVFNYPKDNEKIDLPAGRHGATLILDGIHRSFAFKEKEIKKIAAIEWKEKPLDYPAEPPRMVPGKDSGNGGFKPKQNIGNCRKCQLWRNRHFTLPGP